MGLYLGLDSSTQSLSAIVIDTDSGQVALEESVNFGQELLEFRSPSGFLPNDDPKIKHSDPLMWVEALERLLGKIKARGFDPGRVAGVSGAGQQHGSVYLKTRISDAPAWSEKASLRDQVAPLLSRKTSPIWMDSSTSTECEEIAAAVGGDARLTEITGSRAIERFTGPQIRKFWRSEPGGYEQTSEIHLVSSFMASLLAGRSAAIDLGDGAGMNLLELASSGWSPELLRATATNLESKLLPPVASRTSAGEIAPYFVKKYGFAPGTPIISFTGDNPSSLVGMGATEPGTAVVSLGTSDTVFAAMREPRTDPRGFGHVFGNPAGGFMCLICFANGSLAREAVAKKFDLDWPDFERIILEETEPGNRGNLMLPYFVPEMTPKVLQPKVELFGEPSFAGWGDGKAAVRAIVEAQVLSMQRHSDWIGETPTEVLVTGGASRNRGILQVLADVLGARIRTLAVGNSSALGGALRAAEALEGRAFSELYRMFSAPAADLEIEPAPAARSAYTSLRAAFNGRLDAL